MPNSIIFEKILHMKWGLIGCGRIAQKFIKSLETVNGAELYAIASRSQAEALSKQYSGIKITSDYNDIYTDKDVDIIYISTTHNFHKQNVLDALHHGKHVLCEKPMGIRAKDTAEMLELAKEKGLFIMEAMWTRFLPAYNKMKQLVADGQIGEVKFIQGNFSFNGEHLGKDHRLNNPKLAGGATWDVGIYPLAMVIDLFDEEPSTIYAIGEQSDEDVDLQAAITLGFSKNRKAQLFCGINQDTHHHAMIAGTKGYIILKDFWHGEEVELWKDRKCQAFKIPMDLPTSFSYEIIACYDAIQNKTLEHHIMPHRHTQILANITAEILSQIKD